MPQTKQNYKMVLDFGPFVKGIMSIREAIFRMGFPITPKYITTEYAPKLGVGTDI